MEGQIVPIASDIEVPPERVKQFIDKTAEFVAQNGNTAEREIIVKEGKNPIFQFLRMDNVFRPYYDSKVKEVAKMLGKEAPQRGSNVLAANNRGLTPAQKQEMLMRRAIQKQQKLRSLRPPPADEFITSNCPSLTVMEMDRIKLTAQYISWAGPNFLSALMEREIANPEFDFLKPGHPQYSFFTSLLNSYSNACYLKPQTFMKIQGYAEDENKIMEDCGQRFEYEQAKQSLEKENGEDDDQEDLKQISQIDWYDFIVIGTITFDQDMQAPPLAPFPQHFQAPNPVATQQAAQPKPTQWPTKAPVAQEVQKKPEEKIPQPPSAPSYDPRMVPEKIAAAPVAPTVPAKAVSLPGEDSTIKVLESVPEMEYDTARRGKNKCQKCGKEISAAEFQQHMKICLLDKDWIQQKREMETRREMTTLADGREISDNLNLIRQKRPDIFDKPEEEIKKPNPEKEEELPQKKQFDGFLPNLSRTTANIFMQHQQQIPGLQESLLNPEPKERLGMRKAQYPQPMPINPASFMPPPYMAGPPPHFMQPPPPHMYMAPEQMGGPPSGGFQMMGMPPPGYPGYPMPPQEMQMPMHGTLTPWKGQVGSVEGGGQIQGTLEGSAEINKSNYIPRVSEGMSGLFGMDKMKRGEIKLVPEADWLLMNPDNIKAIMQIPLGGDDEGARWNFYGQQIPLILDPRESIKEVKEKIAIHLNGLPNKKMKLKTNMISILKDENTVASYNIMDGTIIEVGLKGRGGR